MASKYWIKLYLEILDDPKMGRMPDRLWRRTIELFLLAGELDQEGALPKVKDMAWRLRIDDDNLIDDLTYLTNYGIVHKDGEDFIVSKFADRQAPVSDAERMRRMRERQQKEQYYSDAPVTDSVTKRKTDTEENRIDENTEETMLDAFCTITGIPVPINPGVYINWLNEVDEWIVMGVSEGDIRRAYGVAIEKGYTVARPGGLTSFIRGEVSKKNYTGSTNETSRKLIWAHEEEKS